MFHTQQSLFPTISHTHTHSLTHTLTHSLTHSLTHTLMFTGPGTDIHHLIIREFVDILLPYITSTVNASSMQGCLPDSQKHATVSPLLQKPVLDMANMANFCLVSNLTFYVKGH